MEPEVEPSSRARSSPWLFGLLGILAFASLFRSKSHAPVQQPVKPVQAPHNTNRDGDNGKEEDNVTAGTIAVIPVPPTKSKDQDAQSRRRKIKRLRKAGTFWIGLITLLALVAYTTIARNQWKEMIKATAEATKATDAAKSAADTAASQLELAERPWIDANISIDGPFEFNVNGANVRLKFTLRNTGHSPAQSINIYPLLLIGKKKASATAYRDQACKESTRISTTMPQFGMVLFPNVPFEQPYSFGVGKEEIEQEKASKEFPGSKFGEVILSPTVVVCLAYRSTFNRTSVYHTAYIVDLFKRTPIGISPLFNIGEHVDQKQLFLRLDAMNAVSAD